MVRRVLVTGTQGFFGSAVLGALRESGSFDTVGLGHAGLDITDVDAVNGVIDQFPPDVVVNCAGITGNANCSRHPQLAYKVNVDGARNLAAACATRGILLVHPSSVVVFDGKAGQYLETDMVCPAENNPYAETKAASEWVVLESAARHIIPRVTTGLGPVGTRQTTNFIRLVTKRLQSGQPLTLFSDQFTNPVLVNEVADAIIALVQRGLDDDIIHLGGPEVVSMFVLGCIIRDEFGLEGEIREGSIGGTTYPPKMTLNTHKAQSLGLGFSGVRDAVRACRGT